LHTKSRQQFNSNTQLHEKQMTVNSMKTSFFPLMFIAK